MYVDNIFSITFQEVTRQYLSKGKCSNQYKAVPAERRKQTEGDTFIKLRLPACI